VSEDKKAAETLTWIAWGAIIFGIILFIPNVSDFRSSNLPLMVSFGCLIAGVNILLFSAVFRLLSLGRQRAD